MIDVTPRALGSRYELRQTIGSGAMGHVWLAWDRQAERAVAAKILHSGLAANPTMVTRFVQERALLLDLRHPNIVDIYDMVVEGDKLAIVMELVEGGSLRQRREALGTLPVGQAVDVTIGVLTAVAYAHSHGVLHRDIKSDNVLLADRAGLDAASVRLTDFGIARLAPDAVIQSTNLMGTPLYISPEMFDDKIYSQSSDVYAAGTLLYELLAGRTPFEGAGSIWDLGIRHVYAPPPVLDVPAPLWQIIAPMLSKRSSDRPTALGAIKALSERIQAVSLSNLTVPKSALSFNAKLTGTGTCGRLKTVLMSNTPERRPGPQPLTGTTDRLPA